MSKQGALEDERGFTLVELVLVMTLMGIVFAIASSTWLGVIESRKVDSATNQVVADLRLAHSRATNRLEDWQVIFAGNSTYTIGPTGAPIDKDLDDYPASDPVIVDVDPNTTITFKPTGSAVLPGGASSYTFTISSADGDPNHDIVINAATSGIEIAP
jgi:prepilin-type N-terminal cleavage/methylation domain-containing protein